MAGRSLGTLTLDLLLKVGGFKQGADQAARTSDKLAKKMKADAAEITGAFKKIGATIGVGFGLSQIVSGLISATSEAIKFGDEMSRAAIKSGASAETMSELAYAAQLADVEFGGLSAGIIKLQKNISAAAQGNKAAAESFALLGLRVSDLKGLDAADQLELVADAISHIEDDADRTAAVLAIFGKAGADLLPLFEQGAAGIRAAREEAHKLNVTLTDEQAKAWAETDDAIVRMKASFSGLSRTILSELAPALQEAATQLTELFSGSAEGQQQRALRILKDIEAQTVSYLSNASGKTERVTRGSGALLIGVPGIPAGYYGANEITAMRKAAEDALKPTAELGGEARTRAMSRGPGEAGNVAAANIAAKDGAAAAAKAADDAAKAAAERLRIEAQALDELAQRYEDTYTRGAEAMAAARTESEVALDILNEQRAALDALAETYPNMAEAALEAKATLEEKFLEEPLIVATKIEIPPPPKTEIDVFKEHMAGELQDIVADFLVNPFDKGFDEILAGFAKMIAQMMAQALAADIVKSLMGGGGAGGIGGFFAGLFETGGFVPPGQFGIAGEAGPEVVMGGRTGQTVVPMAASAPAPQVNLRNINAFDVGVIRDYLVSAQGEEVMLNFIERNGTRVRMASVGG